MKRRIIGNRILPVCIILSAACWLNAQTQVAMPYNSGPVTYTLDPLTQCSLIFTDDGVGDTPYSPGCGTGSVVTFLPSVAGNKVIVQFTSFYTEPGFDGLFVYDGPSVLAPQINSGAIALLGLPNPFSAGMSAWQGATAPYNVAPATVRATAANTSGALTFAFDSDASVGKNGWTAIVSEVPGNVCTVLAPGALQVAAPAGACAADVQTALPNIQPGACSLALELRYRLNEGPAVTVPAPAPPVIVLQDVPVGLNVVSWQLVESCAGGLVTSAAQLITVTDHTPPALVVPANVTLNLDAGQCAVPYHYSVSAADNCSSDVPVRVEHPVDFDNGAAGILFDVKNLGAEPIVITEFGPVLDAGSWPIEVYITKDAPSWQGVEDVPSAWLLAGARLVAAAGPPASVPLTGFHLLLPPGASRGIYLTSTIGAPVRFTGTQRQADNGVLRVSSAPGASKGYPFGQTTLSRAYNGYVSYISPRLTPQQIAGLPPGAAFPAGATVNVFSCTDAAGNKATASFSVTVQPFGSPVNALICAGTVNASLGPDCSTTLSADDILIGGPYRCYETYTVQLDKIPPFQDGPWVPAHLNAADVGKSYGVRVLDPSNGNLCLGTVLVEDKLPPALTGTDIELPCNFDVTPTYSAAATMSRAFLPLTTLPVNVTDYRTVELKIPAAGPADAAVEDIDVYLKITGDVFEKNLWVELESPAGVKVVLWKHLTGCTGPLWARFDDAGSGSPDCTMFTTNQRVQAPPGGGVLAAFNGQPLNGNWKLRIGDSNGYGDLAVVTEARLEVRYKATFSAGFPGGLIFPGQLTQVSPSVFVAPAPLLDGCSDVTLSYADEQTTMPCSTGLSVVIKRSWTARDASNNTAKYVQTIRLMRPAFGDVTLPPDFNDLDAPALECGGAYPLPAWIESQGKQGSPYVFGRPSGCSINWSYTDVVVSICPGSYSVNRGWSIVDACSAQSTQAMQLIQVRDRTAPVINCPANQTVSTDLYTCCATVNVPDMVVADACSAIGTVQAKVVVFNQYSGDTTEVTTITGALGNFPGNNPTNPDTLAVFGNTHCLPVGVHQVHYKVEDACGNLKTCSITLSVRDYTPPVAVGHNLTVVALNADDTHDCYEPGADGIHFAGVATLPASVFDQGSYDNCNFVRVTVRRVPPYSACIQALNGQNGTPPCFDGFPDLKSEYARATGESDSIKFYCCEAGTTQNLALRCYQLNALGQYSLGANGMPVFNETLVKVDVQDKLKPGCQPPPDVTVSCENFDATLTGYGLPGLQDNCCLDTAKHYQNKPGLAYALNSTLFDTVCNRGTLVRTFTVFDCQGQTSQCTQQIVVTREVDYAIRFPDDLVLPLCDSSGFFGAPVFYGKDCESLAVSFTDEIFTVVPDACYQIERTWQVIDWCDHLPGSNCVKVPNPTPNATLNAAQNLPGPIVSAPGTLAPWTATVVKTTPTSPQATDYSTFWNPAVNCYEYIQVIKVIDTKAPAVEQCPPGTADFMDLTPNTTGLWNESYWFDAAAGSHNLCEGPADLLVTGASLCAGANVNIHYLLFLDLDGDGTQETVVNSANMPAANTVMFGNAANPNFSGGAARAFDARPVPQAEQYRFALQTTVNGSKTTAAVRWNTQQSPDTYLVPELPGGKHLIRWVVSDGCGNETLCERPFVVKDGKAPTVVCTNGLSVNTSPSTIAQLWATDFLEYTEDNCTPSNLLVTAIRKSGTGAGFPLNPDGTPQKGVQFTCNELGNQKVELWAMDLAGNTGFCETYVLVQDNTNACTGTTASVAGTLATEQAGGLADASVALQATHAALPAFVALSDAAGKYFHNGVPAGDDYTITPEKDIDPLNGVSTFDLVLINKHILGLEPLGSPFKMIAADVNNSRSITTFDIVELRKLILGIYSDFPDVSSWRFVDAAYQFPNLANPFQEVFPETKQITNLQAATASQDFVAVKSGDVNGNAQTSSLLSVDDRAAGTLLFDVTPTVSRRAVKAGEQFTLHFRAAEKVAGYQFTLYFPNLEVVDITPGAEMTAGNFGIFAAEHALTTSFNQDQVAGEFTVTFQATAAGEISKMLTVSSRITKAEAYKANVVNGVNVVNVVNVVNGVNEVNGGNVVNEVNGGNAVNDAMAKMSIALRFSTPEGQVVAGQGFELYQNAPNPWVSKTRIGFYLPEATEATLTVFDETGRALFTQTGDYSRGYNAVPLDRSVLRATGVLYYKLETATDSAVKKMIQTK